ncbi:hypothetical protein [Campylobacter sp. MG1]|uniref:hypothetical protein n=1 Tax=Campylobacter sp. MG1 TaxID=2976332 RepID=UPI00226CC559|nr:hypothetical protein [Campylobacter sp. MG1]
MTNIELCSFIDTSIQTLYNWKKYKPNLYQIVMDFKNNVAKNTVNYNKKDNEEIFVLIEQLSKEEREYYTAVIKADILKKKLNK